MKKNLNNMILKPQDENLGVSEIFKVGYYTETPRRIFYKNNLPKSTSAILKNSTQDILIFSAFGVSGRTDLINLLKYKYPRN